MKHKSTKGTNAKKMSRQERIAILIVLWGSLMWGYQFYPNHNVSSECSVDVIEIREVTASEPKRDLYVPPVAVREQMNLKPGLMAKIRERDWGSDWTYAAELIWRESSFNKRATNPSSGACGYPQSLPCSKMKCSLEDEDCQLDWMSDYVLKRYGNAEKALYFHDIKGWY